MRNLLYNNLLILVVLQLSTTKAQLSFSISDIANPKNSNHFENDAKNVDLTEKPENVAEKIKFKPNKIHQKSGIVSLKKSVSYDRTAQGGSINPHRKNDTILTFEVKKRDDQGNLFICLKVQFALAIELQNVTSSFDSEKNIDLKQTMTNLTNADIGYSSCDTLLLNWENSGDDPKDKSGSNPTVLLKFSVEQSEKDGGNVQIYYLQNLKVDDLVFLETFDSNDQKNVSNHKAATMLPFMKEGPRKPKSEQDPDDEQPEITPVEASTDESFKCYFGFNCENNNSIREPSDDKNQFQKVVFKFDHFQMQVVDRFNKDSTNQWKPVLSCDYDVSRILPIIVGTVLGGIVIFTIVGYFIAKKRSDRNGYQEL